MRRLIMVMLEFAVNLLSRAYYFPPSSVVSTHRATLDSVIAVYTIQREITGHSHTGETYLALVQHSGTHSMRPETQKINNTSLRTQQSNANLELCI